MKKIIFKSRWYMNNAVWWLASAAMDVSNRICAITKNPMGKIEDGLFSAGHRVSQQCNNNATKLRLEFYGG